MLEESIDRWLEFISSKEYEALHEKNPGLALWIFDVDFYTYLDVSHLLIKELSYARKHIYNNYYPTIKLRNVSKDKLNTFINIYMKKHLRFNNNEARIYYGSNFCQLPKKTLQHFICTFIFECRDCQQVSRDEIIDFVLDHLEQIDQSKEKDEKDLKRRAIKDAINEINTAFIESFCFVNKLIEGNKTSFWLNKDLVKI